MTNIDPITEEFLIKKCFVDNAIFPVGHKRCIVRKISRDLKAAFFGVPILGFLMKDVIS